MEETGDYEVLQVKQDPMQDIIQMDAEERTNVDTQVATAKRYPRDLARCIKNSIAMATMDTDTAASCGYALPRGGKLITGHSVHLAKLIVSNWGNIRAETKVVQITDKHVISRGTCWDLESNVAVAVEVRRSIVGKGGARFSDDMITVAGNAANAIAYRNAVFDVIPKAVSEKVYKATRELLKGDSLSTAELEERRKNCIGFFRDHGITEEEVSMLCGNIPVGQIKGEQLESLLSIAQALKDGDTTVEAMMIPFRKKKNKAAIAEAAALSAAASAGDAGDSNDGGL